MNDNKQIKEMAEDIRRIKELQASNMYTPNYQEAMALISLGYQKCKDKVVLSKEEYEQLAVEYKRWEKLAIEDLLTQERNQAVKEVLEKTKEKCKELEDKFSHLCKSKKECLMETCRYEGVLAVKRELNEIAKEFGVEL